MNQLCTCTQFPKGAFFFGKSIPALRFPFGQQICNPHNVVFLVAERPQGSFSRQLFLGENLDTDSSTTVSASSPDRVR
jgi:hypothetical protein